jgi:hypothetical protein
MFKNAEGNWVQEKILPGKGLQGENCNRRACQRSGAYYFNKSTRAYYCQACAEMIEASSLSYGGLSIFEGLDVTVENAWRYGGK